MQPRLPGFGHQFISFSSPTENAPGSDKNYAIADVIEPTIYIGRRTKRVVLFSTQRKRENRIDVTARYKKRPTPTADRYLLGEQSQGIGKCQCKPTSPLRHKEDHLPYIHNWSSEGFHSQIAASPMELFLSLPFWLSFADSCRATAIDRTARCCHSAC